MKPDGDHAEIDRHTAAHHGRQHARHQGGVVHDAYADYLQGKHRRRQRGAEKGGKSGAHAAHNHDPFIFLVEPEPSSNLSRHAASQLKSGALPPGGAAQQVGEDRADKNQRRCLNRNRFCGADRPNHQICSLIPLHFRNFIKKHDQQAAQGQKPD